MATCVHNYSESRETFSDGLRDLTFEDYASPKESKYMVKAVGNILLEIQTLLENSRNRLFNSSTPKRSCRNASGSNKRLKYQSKQALSEEEVSDSVNKIDHCRDKTYHRRALDQLVSKNRKPLDRTNGSLKWKDLPSSQLPMVNQSTFQCPDLLSPTPSEEGPNGGSLLGNVYSLTKVDIKISSFVSSFYKHYSIVSYSSFVLSLIYIDRFLKSHKVQDLAELAKFSMTR